MGTGWGGGHGGCPLLFLHLCVGLSFRSAHFFRSAPSPLRLHRRSSLLSTSLFSRRFVFFVRSCVSAFRYLSSYLSSSASLIPVRPLLSPCVSLSASISTLLSALAGSRLWFLSFSVSSPSLSPSVFFPPFWRNLLVFHSACLFSRSFCPPFPYSSTLRERRASVEEVEWREVDGEVRNAEGHGGVERVGLGWMSGARVKGGRGETLFGPFSLICLFLGRFATPDFPLPG